ncbi:MAG: caspase family protein, partial [Actinomycetota bacterium]|nr:caspase family protein [Actinomycetota bacterium]
MRWAIVIGVDHYGDAEMGLSAAVSDALRFREWVRDPSGGDVPESNLRLLLGRRPDRPDGSESDVQPTKDNIVTAINDVVVSAAEGADCLYFYFAGHGITARVANRDESALVTPGFDALHTDHSLAIRSLTEHLETTPFADQFFFIDACRNVPWADREFEIGRWPVPRRRDPGAPPVQQFILYATSPGRAAAEHGWPGEADGAFTSALMDGLAGKDEAKAWSWERNCYEVRWERLATFVNKAMTKQAGKRPAEVPAGEWPVQIPQDTGSRGVVGRDRDARLASFPRGHFGSLELTIELKADPNYDEAEVSVLDAIGEPVVSALKVTGTSHTFALPPKTYAVRALTTTPVERVGSLTAPVELYESCTETIELLPREPPPPGEVSERLGPDLPDAVEAGLFFAFVASSRHGHDAPRVVADLGDGERVGGADRDRAGRRGAAGRCDLFRPEPLR